MTFNERLYRYLLVVYPSEHRREYGELMTQMLRDRLRDEGGGLSTVLVWGHIGVDLARSALSERTETTMTTFKTRWWLFAAGFIAPVIAFFAIGNGMSDDGGPQWGRIGGAVVGTLAAAVIVTGLLVRKRRRALGSLLVAIGALPGSYLILFLWFPPVALMGVLSIAVAVKAFQDAGDHRKRAPAPALKA